MCDVIEILIKRRNERIIWGKNPKKRFIIKVF